MKKVFLLLGLAIVFSAIFYFVLISSPHPMGFWRLLVLMVSGAIGLLAAYEGVHEIHSIFRLMIVSRRLCRRIQAHPMGAQRQ